MIVTKARKVGCSLVIVHHTGKTLNLGPDGVPTWRGSYDMATRLDKTICLLPCPSSMDGYVTFQVLEGKSRRGQRLNTSIQFSIQINIGYSTNRALAHDSSSIPLHLGTRKRSNTWTEINTPRYSEGKFCLTFHRCVVLGSDEIIISDLSW